MNKALFLFLIPFLITMPLLAQISDGGSPKSFSINTLKAAVSIPGYTLKKINRAQLIEADKSFPTPYRYGVFEDVAINLRFSAKSDVLAGDMGTIYRYRIAADSAKSIQVVFSKFCLPSGASLFLYDDNHNRIFGAFTNRNMQQDSSFVIADFIGDHVVVEYFEPAHPEFEGDLIIGAIAQAYKDIFSLEESSTSGYININCPEGKDVQEQKHAVCRFTFRSGRYLAKCSGALLNNVRQDGKPYFLTANHCVSTSAEASSLVAYFNYEYEGCDVSDNAAINNYTTISGGSLLTTASASDYSLILLDNKPPANAQPYYAGWNANDSVSNYVTGIHHPEGYAKKLVIDIDSIKTFPYSIQWDGGVNTPGSTHWEVNFDVGITSGGSSGSPLFSSRKQIIGQLHGGDDVYDYYGKLSYSWTHSNGYPTLKSFLDPDNTGTLSLGGYNPAGNPPDAFFVVSPRLCMNEPIKLTDYSAFPHARTWTIAPSAGVTYLDGTSETSAEPVVLFASQGTYSIQLDVNNTGGTDSKHESVETGNNINIEATLLSNDVVCLCNASRLRITATGANDYSWQVPDEYIDEVVLNKSTGDTIVADVLLGILPDSTISPGIIRVIGVQGSCADTIIYSQALIKPGNDYIKNAYQLGYGTSDYFSNECATIEENEPIPPCTSCISQLSWCDEYNTGDNIVERSVWFKFIPTRSGNISIYSEGFDNEIALYEADSYQDILSGNYTLLAANDDRSTTNSSPIIRSAGVVSGKNYWIQVDGSAGGAVGDFTIRITTLVTTGVSKEQEQIIVVYPQPAKEYVIIQGDDLSNIPLQLSVYSSTGLLVHAESILDGEGQIRVNTSTWAAGIYMARINTEDSCYTARIVKY
jgi:hypothetical protein